VYPGKYAATEPGRIAARMAGPDGDVLSYGDLEDRSIRLAHVLRDAGLRPGDVVALLTDNDPPAFEVAVIGVPDAEMGQSVAAFIQLAAGVAPGPDLEAEIIAFVKARIARFKAPRIVRFVDHLPRTETGKLAKATLREQMS